MISGGKNGTMDSPQPPTDDDTSTGSPVLRPITDDDRQRLIDLITELGPSVRHDRRRATAGVLGTAGALLRVGSGVGTSVVGALARRATSGPLVEGWGLPDEVVQSAVRGLMGAMAGGLGPAEVNSVEAVVDVATRILWPPPGYRAALRTMVEHDLAVEGDWLRPKAYAPRGVVLYLHGGGYLGGSPWTHRATTSRLAMRTNTGVFVPQYRLAPEHPYPAALEDALACYAALLLRGVPPSSVIVAGDSAGGGLAAALGLALVERNLPQPAGYCLTSPEVDLTREDRGSARTNVATDVLPTPIPTAGYVGDADPADPLLSPLFAPTELLAGLAPLLVQAGGREVLCDAQVAFARQAAAAGVPVWLHVEPDMFHVWPLLLPWRLEAHSAESRVCAFVEQHLGPLPLNAAPGLLTAAGSPAGSVDDEQHLASEITAQRSAATAAAAHLEVDERRRPNPFGDDATRS